MQIKPEIINAEFLFILMDNINFRKLIGGGDKAEGSPKVPNTLTPALMTSTFLQRLRSVQAGYQEQSNKLVIIQLNPWTRVLSEKLNVEPVIVQMVEKFSAFYCTPRFIALFTRPAR
jgi:hypothetical protein